MMRDIEDALRWWPFDGDFGMPGDRQLSDKIVTFRKDHTCVECLGPIKPGTRGRSLTMLWDDGDGPVTGRYCTECTMAQAVSFDDDGAAMDRRWELRRQREKSE